MISDRMSVCYVRASLVIPRISRQDRTFMIVNDIMTKIRVFSGRSGGFRVARDKEEPSGKFPKKLTIISAKVTIA
jgi:hypothetical protein